MKKLVICVGLVLSVSAAQAQKYRTALGVRGSRNQIGLTAQQLILPETTLELIASVGSDEFSGTALYEKHFPILGKGLNYYLGGGGHIGNKKDIGTFYGGDLIAGLELKIPLLPVIISGDLKPAFHINHEDWFTFGGGISARVILLKEKKKKFRLFGGDDDDKKNSGGIFGPKKEPEPKKKFNWFNSDKE